MVPCASAAPRPDAQASATASTRGRRYGTARVNLTGGGGRVGHCSALFMLPPATLQALKVMAGLAPHRAHWRNQSMKGLVNGLVNECVVLGEVN